MLRASTTIVRQATRRGAQGSFVASRAVSSRVESVRCMASIGAMLDQMADEIPAKEAMHYPKLKWTRRDVKLASDALATGYLWLGLRPGDTIVSWLPADSMDVPITQFAAAKAGMQLAVADFSLSKEGLEKILRDTKARCLIYDSERGPTDTTEVLKSIMPELKTYDDGDGWLFRSRRLPDLRFLVHTGFDIITGVTNLKHIVPVTAPEDNPIPEVQAQINDDTPLFIPVEADGSKGNALSHADVLKQNAWPIVCSVLNKKYVKMVD